MRREPPPVESTPDDAALALADAAEDLCQRLVDEARIHGDLAAHADVERRQVDGWDRRAAWRLAPARG